MIHSHSRTTGVFRRQNSDTSLRFEDGPTSISRAHREIIRACTLSFFDKYLKGQDDHLLDNPAAVSPISSTFRGSNGTLCRGTTLQRASDPGKDQHDVFWLRFRTFLPVVGLFFPIGTGALRLFVMAEADSAGHFPVSAREFTTTHWSVVLAAGQTETPHAIQALESLCRTYWYPLYVFVRRLGNSPADAQDLTQGFFAYLLEHHLVARADPQAGRFRSFLLGSLKHFLAHEHERAMALKRGGGQPLLSLDEFDPEERYALEPSDAATPETIFDHRWAVLQVQNALSRLRAEYATAGRGPLFDLLKDYVWGDKNALSLGEIAGRLELTEEAVKKSVQRLRQRFRDSLRTEVAQTVATPDQIDEELRHLRAALAAVR